MKAAAAYNKLLEHYKKISALDQVQGLLSWDQETMMPPKGALLRAEQISSLETVLHNLKIDPRILEWATEAQQLENLTVRQKANIYQAKIQCNREKKIPERLVSAIAYEASIGQTIWTKARSNNKFSIFHPSLKKIIALKKNQAECIKNSTESKYDALLRDYEPSITNEKLKVLFNELKPPLIRILKKILGSNKKKPKISGQFPEAGQLRVSKKLASVMGYDLEAGRIDQSTHPFSSGSASDSRITTRVDELDPMGCIFSTIHEVGHALYEQGIPKKIVLEPAGIFSSMGVHESQSRLFENQIGRSEQFCRFMLPIFKEEFKSLTITDGYALFQAVNSVTTGFIRTEADELQYNLHIMLRYNLEEQLIEGKIDAVDLEIAWNKEFKNDFGLDINNPSDGVLQDIHWSAGLFGYFPTYTLGNIYSACIFSKLTEVFPDLGSQLELGEISPLREWLREHIHCHARHFNSTELLENATGSQISSTPLINYLTDKYSKLYQL